MSVQFRTYSYSKDDRFGEDYSKLRDFLIELDDCSYTFGRWDWMITHSHLQEDGLRRIGLWEENGKIAAVATYDTKLDGKCFFPYKKDYAFLLKEMIAYARENLAENNRDGRSRLLIRDGDEAFQAAAAEMRFAPTQDKDCDSVFHIDADKIKYTLPDGFSIVSMKDNPDYYKYGGVLWKGFNHELNGEGPYSPTPEHMRVYRDEFGRPNVNRDIKIAVAAPNGDFAAYCGMWQDAACENALVEPVATDPAYRKMGLGRAAVLEAIRRCGKLGAKRAFVGSSQQFYYQIGFRPWATSTFWEERR
ncbi:MAG: GNAT family N-acetyltransferase [Defluviitaleaceae bacterium]|nr:GNAT family N-acetyltransferase [Defluviitaleaceae bacterium]